METKIKVKNLPRVSLSSFVFCMMALSSFGVQPVAAAEFASSKSPTWRVGILNKNLSFACQRGRFNQAHTFRLSIGYTGKSGQGITGIAQKGWNLKDPKNMGEVGFTYHFFHDGLSNCRVYVAENPRRR
jgi:hypothetical protein